MNIPVNFDSPIPAIALYRDEEFRILVNSIKDYAIFMIDPQGVIKTWNEGAKYIKGYEDYEIIGKNISVFYTKSDIEKGVVEHSLKVAKEQGSLEEEGWRVRKDGTVFWADVFFTACYNELHQLTGYAKVTKDISSQKKIKDDLAKFALKQANLLVLDITEKKILQQQLLEEQLNKQKEITKAVVNAQEKERAEIGEELHDNVNQLLAASKLYLSHSLTEPDYMPSILKSQEYIVTAMEEIRKLSHALVGPNQGKTLGLIDSIEELLSTVFIVKDIKIAFNHSTYDEEESEAGLKLVIYRIIQEQVNNILKHAEASEVEIELKKRENDLILIIKDNGKGFDTSAKRKGIGLTNIKNRAEIYDGTVQIVCHPGNGCKMTIVFSNYKIEKNKNVLA